MAGVRNGAAEELDASSQETGGVRDGIGEADAAPRGETGGGSARKPSWAHPVRRWRAFMHSCSLKTAFVVYAVAATLVALAASTALASTLTSQASEVWYESSAKSGLYVYSEAENALVPSETISWYRRAGEPFYVQVPGDSAPDPIPLGAQDSASDFTVYDGRILSDEQLSRGATDDPIPLADVPIYDAKQRALLDETSGVTDGAEDSLPADAEGNVPASSPVAYYVVFNPPGGVYDALQLMAVLSFPLVFVAVFVVAARLFYRNHMSRPIAAMGDAAQRIADNDLDFELAPDSGNELGRLTESFETMRSSLLESNREMWRMVEARKETNAAFAHDLRTPLTVLRGQVEMLAAYTASGNLSPGHIEEMARSSQRQVERIERYVETMRDLAKLDDCTIVAADVQASELVERLDEAARALAAERDIRAETTASGLRDAMHVDAEAVERIVGNLLANAVRYAETSVALICEADGADLVIIVEDDGPGFSDEALKRGLEPYYRDTSRVDSTEHFGLGLGICAVLANKCGGAVRLANRACGGARVEVRFPEVFKR